MGAKVLKCRLFLCLGILWRSRYRLHTQIEILDVLAVPTLQRILCGISQLTALGPNLGPPGIRVFRL